MTRAGERKDGRHTGASLPADKSTQLGWIIMRRVERREWTGLVPKIKN